MKESSLKKSDRIYLLLLILILLTPLLQLAAVLVFYGKGISDFVPNWGDELWWWCQADAVGRYGSPLGYWGYNGGRAEIGTFAAWGPAMVMPYGLFAFLFGWKWYSWLLANLLYTTIANIVFIRLTKIDTKGLFWLFIANQLIFIKDYYFFTSMAETARWSLGLIAMGLIVFLYQNRDMRWWIKYLLIPLYLAYITQAYLIWALFVLFYLFIMFDDIIGVNKHDIYSIFLKIWGGITTFLIYAYLSRKLLGLFSTPYLPHSSQSLAEAITGNISRMKNFYGSWSRFFFIWFFTSYIELMLYTLVFAVFNAKRLGKRELAVYIASAVTLISFFAGHIVLYADASTWTLVRGMCGGLVIAVFLLAITRHRQGIVLFIICAAIGLPTLSGIHPVFFNEDRFVSERLEKNAAANADLWKSMTGYAERHNGGREYDPWDYTVAAYATGGTDFTLTIPSGYAVSAMFNGEVNYDARYSAVGKLSDPNMAKALMTKISEAGFIKAYEDDRIAGFVNPK